MRKPFNTDYRNAIENNLLDVETENHLPVKIIEWNVEGDYPILGFIESDTNSSKTPILCNKWGRCSEVQLCVVSKEKFNIGDTVCNKYDVTDEGKITDVVIDEIGNTYYEITSKKHDIKYLPITKVELSYVQVASFLSMKNENLTELETKIREIITNTLSGTSDDGTMSFSISISDKETKEITSKILNTVKDYIIIKN